jgi:hypothetical protein
LSSLEGLQTAYSAKRDYHGRAMVTVIADFQAGAWRPRAKCRIIAFTRF